MEMTKVGSMPPYPSLGLRWRGGGYRRYRKKPNGRYQYEIVLAFIEGSKGSATYLRLGEREPGSNRGKGQSPSTTKPRFSLDFVS